MGKKAVDPLCIARLEREKSLINNDLIEIRRKLENRESTITK